MQLTVNGKILEVEAPEPRMILSEFLREHLRLRGVHVSCEMGVCGACTILLDGRPVKSCLMLAVQADGAELMTVEGLATNGNLSRLQELFRSNNALQCGFCTPGMLMNAHSIVAEGQPLDERAVRKALSGNLCRCTGYQGIVTAVSMALAEKNAEDRQ
jgi:aerobic-type carbon monoxide dehydrogenase small subunit (CoxS/CutS family)